MPPAGRSAIGLFGNPRFSNGLRPAFLHGETTVPIAYLAVTAISPSANRMKSKAVCFSFLLPLSLADSCIVASPNKSDPKEWAAFVWCPRQESDLHREIRNLAFYPLNYGSMLLNYCVARYSSATRSAISRSPPERPVVLAGRVSIVRRRRIRLRRKLREQGILSYPLSASGGN